METTKKPSSKTREEMSMQLDLKASTSEEENLTDHYIILRTLGEGTIAEVKLAFHLHTEVQVAVKILENGNNNDYNNKTEIEIVKLLEHPNIIKLFHIISTKEHTFMVMEYAARGNLVSHIEKVGCLQEEQAQHIFTQIVCAVHYCHKNDIAHRDIKLDNILLDDKGNLKQCDFGLAIRVISGQKSKGFCGTLEYCDPELFTDTEYDARAVDVWSMGVVLYTIVTACFPFKAKTFADMKEEMLNPKYYIPPTLSQNIVNLIVQLFTVMPEQRPKISDIRQHQWFKDRKGFWKIPHSSEIYCAIPNSSIVVAMWGMGYDPKDVSACIHEKKFSNIMATYLILKHNSAQDHIDYAVKSRQACVTMLPPDALTSLSLQRRLSEPTLHTFALLAEHQVHDEKTSRKKGSRSLSMPATLCFLQKAEHTPHPAPKCAPMCTYLDMSLEALYEINTPKNCLCTERKPSVRKYRESPQDLTTTDTHGTQRSSLQTTSKNNSEGVPPEAVTAPSASNRSQGWKRIKKRIGNWVRLLCCCLPASRRSHVSQKEVAPLEVESSAVTH
ncbi:hypothetical protein A6R68_05691, partial [Neotoma lepida]